MKKFLLATVFCTVLCFNSNAQENTNKQDIPYIDVSGTAEQEIVPDIIYIGITLSDKLTSKGAEYTLNDQENRLKKIVKDLGVDMSNLVLADASSNVIIKKQKEKGVSQTKDYLLRLSSAAQVSQVFEALYENDIKEAGITKIDHTKITEVRKQTRINAIKAAKDKATYLLDAIGEQLGKPLSISEVDHVNTNVLYTRSNLVNYYNVGGGPEENLAFKKISISYEYFIRYSIK